MVRNLNMRVALAAAIFIQPLLNTSASADHLLGRVARLWEETQYHGTEPATGAATSVECLAEQIDWLEHHIDTYGSIVAKQPDIWGEARLTKHRDEYERMLFEKLAGFDFRINAAIQQSDSAFLAQALALSAAAGGAGLPTVTATTAEAKTVSVSSTANSTSGGADTTPITNRFGITEGNKISLEPTVELDQLSRYLQHLHELRRINEGDDTSDSPGYALNLVRVPVSILPGKLTREGFGAEITVTATPVITDDLLPTTFRNLAVNDVVDLLGLPLVRTAEGLIDGELNAALGSREYRTNVNQIDNAFEAARQAAVFDREQLEKDIRSPIRNLLTNDTVQSTLLVAFKQLRIDQAGDQSKPSAATLAQAIAVPSQGGFSSTEYNTAAARVRLDLFSRASREIAVASDKTKGTETLDLDNLISAIETRDAEAVAKQIVTISLSPSGASSIVEYAAAILHQLGRDAEAQSQGMVPTGHARRALDPLPPSDLVPVVGIETLVTIAESFHPKYEGRYIRWNGGENCEGADRRVDLLDAQRFLQPQVEAAFELLSQPDQVRLFAELAAPGSGLARQLLSSHTTAKTAGVSPAVEAYRHYFFQRLHGETAALPAEEEAHGLLGCETDANALDSHSLEMVDTNAEAIDSVEALAWVVVVEASLLNERLNRDVRKLAKAKEVFDLETPRDYLFFLPETVTRPDQGLEDLAGEFQEASTVFKRYVQVRWPIHVFAVDPREQDQNVADVSLRRRELQFALALGFVTGKIGANSLTQLSRTLETQIETISLNRTVVGFGHGADTFGWRFYPRVQALDTPSLMGAVSETICGTSQDKDLRQRNLEEGQRECVAVVLMPSFVPYVDFDVRANWFKLTNPKNSALTMKETVRLSRAIAAMRNSRAQCTQCAHLYREGEITRMMRRVEQLDRELPLQSMRTQVPYENTLGGFEMFNTGVTDLAPELIGWYGAPGINVSDGYSCGCYQGCTLNTSSCTGDKCNALESQVGTLTEKVKELEASLGSANHVSTPLPACDGPGTTIFLVGKNFSVHDTKVIAGGVCIPRVQLISREIARVTIPSCVNQVSLCEHKATKPYVSVYLSTPYGVTNHLHVPVHGAGMTPAEEADIKSVAQKTAQEAVLAMRLLPPALTVAAAKADQKVVKVAAVPNPGDPSGIICTVNRAEGIEVMYRAAQDPALTGRPVQFFAVVANDDEFLGSELTPIKDFPALAEDATFPALGEGAASELPLLTQIMSKVSLQELQQANGKLKLKLVYFASVSAQAPPLRLLDEIELEVQLAEPPDAKSLEARPLVPAIEAPANPVEPEELPSIEPTSQSNCDCGMGSLTPRVMPTQFSGPIPPMEPLRVSDSELVGATVGEAKPSAMEVLGQQGRLVVGGPPIESIEAASAVIAPLTGSAPPAVNDAVAAATVVNVNVQAAPPAKAKSWWQSHEHPLAGQVKTKLGESWRNLRDQLPCQ